MVRKLYYTFYYHMVMFLRVKQAVFFAFAFPLFLFILFGNLFNTDDDYIKNIMTGVLTMTIASNGFFGIGAVLKEYYNNGWLKHLKHLPIHPFTYFLGLIGSRLINILVLILTLNLAGTYLFNMTLEIKEWAFLLVGSITGFWVFAFLGLALAFSGIKQTNENAFAAIVYYVLLFTSTAFYPVCEFNEALCFTGNLLPMNPVLRLMREGVFTLVLILWAVIPPIVFLRFLRNLKFKR